jgi:hypothetical protein
MTSATGAPPWVALIGAIVRGSPKLAGARCVGRHRLFDDDTDPAGAELATAICQGCPALALCGAYADEIGPRKLSGVWAGKVYAA